MKKSRLLGTVCACVLVIHAGLQSRYAHAVEILYLHDVPSVTFPNLVVNEALNQLSLVAMETTQDDFENDLSSQQWDLVIIDIFSFQLSPLNSFLLGDYVNSGGQSILSYWDLDEDSSLQSAFDVSVNGSNQNPLDVYIWDAANPMFNTPNVVDDLTEFNNNGGDNGDRLFAINGAEAFAGFLTMPVPGESAVVLGNNGNTIANGFLFYDMTQSGGMITQNNIDFVANEIAYLTAVPIPAAVWLFGSGLLGLIGMARRKKTI